MESNNASAVQLSIKADEFKTEVHSGKYVNRAAYYQ